MDCCGFKGLFWNSQHLKVYSRFRGLFWNLKKYSAICLEGTRETKNQPGCAYSRTQDSDPAKSRKQSRCADRQSTMFSGHSDSTTSAGVHKSRAQVHSSDKILYGGSSVQNLFHVTLLVPGIFRWPLKFRQICALLCCSFSNSKSFHMPSINPLQTKRRPLYLKTQFVPRSKHFSSRLQKPISWHYIGQKSLFVLR